VKAYGRDNYHHEDLNSTKTGAEPGNNKSATRRIAKKKRRRADKDGLRRDAQKGNV